MDSLKISILIPTLGKRKLELDRLLRSLLEQSYHNFEVIIITQDNHEIVRAVYKIYKNKINIHQIEINKRGLSLARNIGVSNVSGNIIILSDDDCWYPTYALKVIAESFEKEKNMDVLITQIYDPIQECMYKNYEKKTFKIKKKVSLLSRSSIEIAFRKRMEDIIFDEKFGLGAKYVAGEENDFLIRCLNKKYIIKYKPIITVFHEKKYNKNTKEQIIAKGAFYSKNMGFVISNIVLLRDLIKRHQNNYKWFWYGYYEYKKNDKRVD